MPVRNAATRPRVRAWRSTRSAPAARATTAVPSIEPSSTTITSTCRTCGIRRGTAATTAPTLSASFSAGMTTASLKPAPLSGRPDVTASGDTDRYARWTRSTFRTTSRPSTHASSKPGPPFTVSRDTVPCVQAVVAALAGEHVATGPP